MYWIFQGGAAAITRRVASRGGGTRLFTAESPPLLVTMMALPVALLSLRHSDRAGRLLERSTYLVLAIPGVVIAFALSYFSERYARGSRIRVPRCWCWLTPSCSSPSALVGVRASVAHAPVSLEEVAGSLGLGRMRHRPGDAAAQSRPGLAAAFCLVFLGGVTELTATLLLSRAASRHSPRSSGRTNRTSRTRRRRRSLS